MSPRKFVFLAAGAMLIMTAAACGVKAPQAHYAGPTGPTVKAPLISPTAHAAPPTPPAPTAVTSPSHIGAVSPARPSSCHARGTGLYVLPDPTCTPGATDPAVTQATIDQTICRGGWTSTVRPPEDYTENLKREQMAQYGDTNPISDYEEDHFIPLELGGSPTNPLNLWPEPGASPNPKDAVEDAANAAVCDGRMTLAAAQRAIATNWIAFGQQLGVDTSPPAASSSAAASTPPAGSSASTATCTVTASYNSRYNDYDVYVHSNQPDQSVTVTTSGAPAASWHTDSSGYADVYLKASRSAVGRPFSATVGGASCSGALS